MSCWRGTRSMFTVFKAVFSRTRKRHSEMKNLLQTRAWIIQILYLIIRIFLWISGTSNWLKEKKSCFDSDDDQLPTVDVQTTECSPLRYDNELVDKMR